MSYRTRAEHTVGRQDKSKVRFALTTEAHPADSWLAGTSTLTADTGACWLQTYLTADECRALARSLLAAAVDLDRIAHEQAQPAKEAA